MFQSAKANVPFAGKVKLTVGWQDAFEAGGKGTLAGKTARHTSRSRVADQIASHFMKNLLANFTKDESGATAIEYALIAAIVGIGIITALNSLKGQLNATFTQVSTDLSTANAE